MWTIDDFDGKVLVQYLRKKDKFIPVLNKKLDGPDVKINFIKGEKQGVVVAIGNGIIGWSMCDPADVFSKTKGIHIALERANYASTLSVDELTEFYSKVPQSLEVIAIEMLQRSFSYFKD